MRNSISSNAAFLFCLLGCIPTDAAVIQRDWLTPGDGLLTFDDVNQREWLDLTETQLFNFPGDTLLEQYQAVVAETQPGGDFAGFSVALEADVFALAESAGINTSTLSFFVNRDATGTLIDFVSATGISAMDSASRLAEGAVIDLDQESFSVAIGVAGGVRPGSERTGFFVTSPDGDDGIGVWLSRPVPEPSSIALGALLLASTVAIRFCVLPLRGSEQA